MKPVNEEYIPDSGLEKEEMKEMQRRISEEAVFHDDFDFEFSIDDLEEKTVVGVDQAFTDDKSVSTAVVIEDGEVVEEASAAVDLEMPYIPGLLAFREGESIVKALKKIESEVDLVIFDGSGRIHYREAGIATHIGVIFDIPAVGVAKNLLCGTPQREWEKMSEGSKIPVKADKEVKTVEKGEIIGYVFQSKQYDGDRKINPLYVSPGHRISAGSAVRAVEKFCKGYKLPQPTYLADKKVSEIKKDY